MLTLAIETSNPSTPAPAVCGCAIGRLMPGGPVLLASEALRQATRHDDDLMPCIDRLLLRSAISPRQIELVAVSAGPGGFTALRVACATAKMIALGSGAKCVAVPSTLVAATAACADAGNGNVGERFAVALAGKGDTAFVAIFRSPVADGAPRLAVPGRVMDVGDLVEAGVSFVLADPHLPAPMRAALDEAGIPIRPPAQTAEFCLHAAAAIEPIDAAVLAPIYGREPEAVTLWRARHATGESKHR